jgi:uncharacterized protein YjiS (DUF1127 family)
MLPSSLGENARATALARRLGRLRHRAGRGLQRLLERADLWLRAWAARRLAGEMAAWSDERLRDIGLSRSDLASAVEGVRRPFRWVPDHDASRMDPARFGH